MHYYQFNIGDYAKATRHLTNLEDLAYRRLIELYYDTEKPLIKDVKKLARLVNMRKNHEDVKAVLDDFFFETDEGYKQNRIEKELADYRSIADTARANGKKGGRPKKPSGFPVGCQREPRTNPEQTQNKPDRKLTNNHKPITNNQNKKTSGQPAYSEAFERWWLITPKREGRRRGKRNAFDIFKKIPASEYADLKTATINYASEEFIKDPERFLKNEWWKDFISDPTPEDKKNDPTDWVD